MAVEFIGRAKHLGYIHRTSKPNEYVPVFDVHRESQRQMQFRKSLPDRRPFQRVRGVARIAR